MTENESDLVLDGNAAASLLEEMFAPEITSAQVDAVTSLVASPNT